MIRSLITIFLMSGALMLLSCNFKNAKSEILVEFTQDTLDVGYTYWWTQRTPFNENCSDTHSLVFTGTIANMDGPNTDSGPLYTAQKGLIEVERVFKIKDIGENIYAEQKFISTDCFYESGLQKGDTVLVFCYDYENAYTIPGKECIVKITGFEDPLVDSIREYIDAGDDPLAIKQDIELWASVGLGLALEASVECSKEQNRTTGR